ncbi:MAG: hypothetical protein U5N85_05220 [Arcicella sp.]|nr:hypothetical protein [Arcicella sp.]
MKDYNTLVIQVGYFLILTRLIIILSFFPNLRWAFKNKAYRFLFMYALIALSIALFELIFIYVCNHYTSSIMPLLTRFKIGDTFFISPLYYLNSLFFYGFTFSYALGSNYRKPIQIISLALFAFEICNTIWGEGFRDAQTAGSLIVSFVEIGFSLLYLQNFYTEQLNKNVTKDSFAVISWGILIPAILSIFIYAFTKKLFETNEILYYQISIFRMIIESLCFLIIAYGVCTLKDDSFERKLKKKN